MSRSVLTASRLNRLLAWTILLLALATPALGQQVILHRDSARVEDGNPRVDADGVKNGVVVWKGGAVHVVVEQYYVDPGYSLIVQPGAVVKFASVFNVADNGRVLSWQPPLGDAGIISQSAPGGEPPWGVIQITGATLTDIRDASVGGDTVQDGGKSSPSGLGYGLIFSGTAGDYLQASTIKYCGKVGHFGSMNITNNKFLMFGGMRPDTTMFWSPVVLDAAPVITQNTFEFAPYGDLDLRGMSPVVDGNTLRGGSGIQSGGITIGPQTEYGGGFGEKVGPTTGRTVVSNNRIEGGFYGIRIYTVDGDKLYTRVRFRADIEGNSLRGPGGGRGVGLELALDAEATVAANAVSNYRTPLALSYNNRTETSRLNITSNQFSLEGYVDFGPSYAPRVPESLWRKGHFVQAANNFWGDPTGPLDPSDADGDSNPGGKGIRIGDGIQYLPFLGQAPPPIQDALRVTVSSSPSAPLMPNTAVTFSVAASYQLKSAPTGRIVVLVRDAAGIVLNQPETSVPVTAQNSLAAIPPLQVQVKVPELTDMLTVEAVLVPDGGGESVRSTPQPFVVARPPSSFHIDITGVPSGSPPALVRGSKAQIKVTLNYTLTTAGSGRFEIDLKERARGSGQILRDFPLITLAATPGNNKTVESGVMAVDVPLRDVLLTPPSELYARVSFTDGAGALVGQEARVRPIDDSPDTVRFSLVVPGEVSNGMIRQRPYLVAGQVPVYAAQFGYAIGTPNVTTWQIWLGYDEALDAKGAVLYRFTPQKAVVPSASTGPEKEATQLLVGTTPIPAGTRKLRVSVRLVVPENQITVAAASWDLEVRDTP